MKAKFALILVVAIEIGAGLMLAQTKRDRVAKEFMREKLGHSQRVLEGIVTEDFDLIIAKGAVLSAMTREADWRLFENPEYDEQSRVFRRHVDAIVKAARDKNSEAATLSYVRMTMSCVDCHRLVRGKLVASTR